MRRKFRTRIDNEPELISENQKYPAFLNSDGTINYQGLLGISLLILLFLIGVYLYQFGLEPIDKDLWVSYQRRTTYFWGMRVRQNMPFLPNKLFTLLGIGSSLIAFCLFYYYSQNGKNNIFTRLGLLLAVVMGFPAAIYIITYLSFLIGVAIVVWLVFAIFRWIFFGTSKTP